MGVIIGIFIGMLLIALWFDLYWLMGHYSRIVFSVIVSIPFMPFALIYHFVYGLPHDKRCMRLLRNRGWKKSNEVSGPNHWFNSQMWRSPKDGKDYWFSDAYKMETGKETRMRGLVLNFKRN